MRARIQVQCSYLLVTCLYLAGLVSARSVTESETSSSRGGIQRNQLVAVEDLTQMWSRGSKVVPLPEKLEVSFRVKGRPVQLRLRKNKHIDLDSIPVTFANNSTHIREKSQKNVAYYQDVTTGAVVSVMSTEENGQVVHRYSGSFEMEDEMYGIEPETPSTGATPVADTLPTNALPEKPTTKHNIYKVDKPEGQTGYVKPADQINKVDYETVTYTVTEGGVDVNVTRRDTRDRRRQRRATSVASYHIELLFVLDHTIWKKWLDEADGDESDALAKIKYYFGNIFNGMDMAYSSWDVDKWGFSIKLFLKGFFIAQTTSESWWTVESISRLRTAHVDTDIDHSVVLTKMGEFVSQDGRSWSSPDHGMFWTRYDIDGNSAIGYAYIEGVCRGKQSVSIIEDTGFNAWSTAAHELGHSLGASHDGESRPDSKPNDCNPDDQYIMESGGNSLTTDKLENTFQFSDCSLKFFRDTLDGTTDEYPRVCLTNRVCEHGSDTDLPGKSDKLPGEVYSASEQCKLVHGSSSSECGRNGEDICFTIYCQSEYNGVFDCWGRSPGAADGTPCATGKWCMRGECVDKTENPATGAISTCQATSLPTRVPSGCEDESGWYGRVNGVRHNCEELATNYPHFCFSWQAAVEGCCATCARFGLVEPTQHLVESIDGGWSDWSDWSTCSVTCRTGSQTRYRTCTDPEPQDGGSDCGGDATQTRSCDRGSCNAVPVDGDWGSWNRWSSCSVTCGTGVRRRQRDCDDPEPSNGGEDCSGSGEQSKTCERSTACPVDGGWGWWSSWSGCSVTCGNGARTRRRECDDPEPQNGGDDCGGSSTDTKTCEEDMCRGTWESWGSWGACSVTCGTGREYRTRSCNGENCVGSGQKRRDCNPGDCPVHGAWSSWGSWDSCNAECGSGTQTRERRCDTPAPTNGGDPCAGDEEDTQFCVRGSCRVDGAWGSWTPWSACSSTCGTGSQSRTRDCDSPIAANGGTECGGDDEESQDCEGDCLGPWLPWSEWGACSVTCDGGSRSRSRECERESACSGEPSETGDCSERDCDTSSARMVTPRVFLSLLTFLVVAFVLQ